MTHARVTPPTVTILAESVDLPAGSTLAFAHGSDALTGDRVSVAGDSRALRDLRDAIDAAGPQMIAVERGQVIRRFRVQA